MFYLLADTDKIEVFLGGAPVSQCPWSSNAEEGQDAGPTTTLRSRGTTASTTPVTILAGPTAPAERALRYFILRNPNVLSVVLTIRVTAGGTSDFVFNMDGGDIVEFIEGYGFKFTNSSGSLKTNETSSGGAGTLTVTDGSTTVNNVDTIEVDPGDLTDLTGGAVAIATSGGGGGSVDPGLFNILAFRGR